MIEALAGLPDGVIGFEAVGEVHSDDYADVLLPAVEAAAATGAIRLVYVLGDRFEGYSSGAAWQDAKLGMGHIHAWKRTAIVTEIEWLTHLASVFAWMIPGEFRHYRLAEKEAAIEWVAGHS